MKTSSRSRLGQHACTVITLILGITVISRAQVDPNLEQGIKPYGAYYGSSFDSVSMVNGGLTIKVPLFSYPQRGSKLTLAGC